VRKCEKGQVSNLPLPGIAIRLPDSARCRDHKTALVIDVSGLLAHQYVDCLLDLFKIGLIWGVLIPKGGLSVGRVIPGEMTG